MATKVLCPEKDGLLGQYAAISCETRQQLAKAFLTATVELEKVTQEMEDILSDASPNVVNEAYAACEKALMDLYRHKAKHGC
jgi:hypothetical protein